jgi:hypothetical protein
MNGSHDRRDYPNLDARVSWLAQVSDAATALAGTRLPDQFKGSTETSRISVANVKFRSLSVRRDDSFNPNVPPASSHVRSSSIAALASGLLMISALAASLVAGQFALYPILSISVHGLLAFAGSAAGP